MNNSVYEINWIDLSLGYILLLLPIYILYRYKTGLVKDTLLSFARMALQLFLVGLYLEFIFEYNKIWINTLWVIVMIVVATFTTVHRGEIKNYRFLWPIGAALSTGLAFISLTFLLIAIDVESFMNARYFIPISGMIIGNCMERTIISLNTFYTTIVKEYEVYQYYIANGASRNEALKPFFSEALKKSFNPLIANTAVTGLIALPGMMTGQILGGSTPGVAIKYQILMLLCIFIASFVSVYLGLLWSTGLIIDKRENLIEYK